MSKKMILLIENIEREISDSLDAVLDEVQQRRSGDIVMKKFSERLTSEVRSAEAILKTIQDPKATQHETFAAKISGIELSRNVAREMTEANQAEILRIEGRISALRGIAGKVQTIRSETVQEMKVRAEKRSASKKSRGPKR